jgi:multidrug efflux pump subunit AcrA (membrane-fusion protein)
MSSSKSVTGNKSSSEGGWLHILGNVVGSIIILGLGVFGLLFFGRSPEVPTDTSRLKSASEPPLVETAEVTPWDKPFHLDIDGEATSYRVLTVGAEVTGRVLKKSDETRSGTFVNQGDVLFEVDPVNYQLDQQRLQARVDQATQELKAIEVDLQNGAALLKLAQEDNELQKEHLERVKTAAARKAASEAELDNAARQELTSRNAVQMQQNQLNTLAQTKKTKEAALKLAEAELQRTRVDLERCRIVAPITGRIVDDMKEEGDYVKPGDTLVHISDSSRMEVKCSLKGQELAWIWQHGQQSDEPPIATSETSAKTAAAPTENTAAANDAISTAEPRKADPFQMPNVPCEIAFEFEGVETVWDGYLSRYEGTGMDRATRMFPCRVIVDAPEKTRVNSPDGMNQVSPPTLLSGMYVTVRIPIDSPVQLLQVPAESIRPGGQIWVVRDSKLKVVSISLVRVDGDLALVRQEEETLKAQDVVIVSPLASVTDGMPVTVAADLKTIPPPSATADPASKNEPQPATDAEDSSAKSQQEVKP